MAIAILPPTVWVTPCRSSPANYGRIYRDYGRCGNCILADASAGEGGASPTDVLASRIGTIRVARCRLREQTVSRRAEQRGDMSVPATIPARPDHPDASMTEAPGTLLRGPTYGAV
jgi:hypothetical protein